jgi:hypothetical protein
MATLIENNLKMKRYKSLFRDAYGCHTQGDIFVFDKVIDGKNRYTFKIQNADESKRVWCFCEEHLDLFEEVLEDESKE